MKSYNKAVFFRIPRVITSDITHFPPQASGIISNYLRKNDIEVRSYDLREVLGKKRAYDLYSKIYRGIPGTESPDERQFPEFDAYFEEIRKKTGLNGFPLVLVSPEVPSVEACFLAILLSDYIKRINRDALIICGDPSRQIDLLAELKRKNKLRSIDFIVKTHYIENITKIIDAMEHGKDFAGIPAIIYYDKNREQVVETPYPEQPQILDMLDFDNLDLEYYKLRASDYLPLKYLQDPSERILLVPFTFIHGCPHKCAFCVNSVSACLKYLKPADVVRILGELSDKYKTGYFIFLNNLLNINYGYVDELCDRIIGSGMKIFWSDCVSTKYFDKKLLFKMRKAGAVKLYFGLETGSDRMLEFCQKGITSKDAAKCLEWSHEAGIWNGVEIIAGLPHEREQDIDNTIDFLNSNRNVIDEMTVNEFMLQRDSYFFEDPSSFKIDNIIDYGLDIYERLKGSGNQVMDWPSFRFGFDEVNGKKWKDKMEQIIHSYNKVVSHSNVNMYPSIGIDQHVLFCLYKNIGDKEGVRKAYRSFLRREHFKKLFNKSEMLSLFTHGQYALRALKFLKMISA